MTARGRRVGYGFAGLTGKGFHLFKYYRRKAFGFKYFIPFPQDFPLVGTHHGNPLRAYNFHK